MYLERPVHGPYQEATGLCTFCEPTHSKQAGSRNDVATLAYVGQVTTVLETMWNYNHDRPALHINRCLL